MQHTTLEVGDTACWINFDDGKVNALNIDLLNSLREQLEATKPHGRPVVLSGRPGIFSAGFDMNTVGGSRDQKVALLNAGIDLIVALLSHPLPVITLCTGHAFPMGAFLLLSADYRIGLEGEWSIGLNEVAIKMTVPPFALALPRHRLTPPGLARVATAALLQPQQAVSYGYLDEVVADEELTARAEQMALQFTGLDSDSYVATKRALNQTVIEQVLGAKYQFLY